MVHAVVVESNILPGTYSGDSLVQHVLALLLWEAQVGSASGTTAHVLGNVGSRNAHAAAMSDADDRVDYHAITACGER